MIMLFILTNVALILAILVALVVKYRRTRDAGFLVLILAVVGWPLAAEIVVPVIQIQIDSIAAMHPVMYPFSLFAQGSRPLGELIAGARLLGRLVGSVLLFMAVCLLSRRSPHTPTPTTSES